MICRDEFAARAMEVLLKDELDRSKEAIDEKAIAAQAYAMALAMMEAREQSMSDPERKKL